MKGPRKFLLLGESAAHNDVDPTKFLVLHDLFLVFSNLDNIQIELDYSQHIRLCYKILHSEQR